MEKCVWYWIKKKKQLVVLNTFYNVYKLQFQQQGKKNFDKFFDKSVINKISRSSGFVMRKARKISGYHFVLGFLISSSKKQYSFRGWAMQIGLLNGKCVSKQGLFERIHHGAVAFGRSLLQQALLQQSSKSFSSPLFAGFRRVLLHDSTTLHLPQVLSGIFPGNYSHGEQKAVARIQSLIDIKAMNFIDFALGCFTQNDQSASGSILGFVKKGDLLIRDLGYFAISAFEALIKADVFFLSRLRYGLRLYDRQGCALRLKDLMKQNKPVDQWVYMGAEKQVWVRIIMQPLPPGQVAERIRKAKQDRDNRLNHTREYYQWLKYSVYITTVDKDVWTPGDVVRAYRVRWQIEMIFKSWKSGFHLQELLHEGCSNEYRVKVSIYLMLLFICLFMRKIYMRYKMVVEKQTCKKISLLKLVTFAGQNIFDIFLVPHRKLKELLTQYCCYEKRSNRINMTDLYQNCKN